MCTLLCVGSRRSIPSVKPTQGPAMALVMGRSCGYGVHLRSCLVSVSPSMSPNSLASLSRLASCFFLRFSSSSCRNCRLKLSAAPASAYGRRVLFIHGEAEQEGSSVSSPFALQQSPATKQPSSSKKKMETSGHELDAQSTHASLLEDASAALLSAPSKVKVTRRKKTDIETPSQASENSLCRDEKPAIPKRMHKKAILPDIGSIDVETVLLDESPPSKPLRRRKKNTLAEATALDEEDASLASSLPQSLSTDAISSSPKKAPRKKKTLSSDSPKAADRKQRALEDEQKSVEEVTFENKAILAAPAKRARNKKISPSVLAEEVQEKKLGSPEEMNKLETIVLQEEYAKPRGRKQLSLKAKQVALSMLETDAASSASLATALTEEKPVMSEANFFVLEEIEETLSPKRRCKVSKAKESTDQIMDSGLLFENTTSIKVQRRKNKPKEPSISLESDQPSSETVSLSLSDVAAGSFFPKSTPKVDSFTHEDKKEGSESCLSQEVRNVENSVDKASLTDEMPAISVAGSNATSRRSLSEALGMSRDSSMINLSVDKVGIGDTLTGTSNLIPEIMSIVDDSVFENSGELAVEKDRTSRFKSSTAHNLIREQAKKKESEIFDKVNFANGIDQKWDVSKVMPHEKEDTNKKDDSISHSSRQNNLGGTFGQKQMVPGRNASPPMWTERVHRSTIFPASSQRLDPNKQGNTDRVFERGNRSREDIQQWVLSKKSDTLVKQVAKGVAVRIEETGSNVLFKPADHNERDLRQGYNLANIDRVYGKEQKKRKEFSVRKVFGNKASTTSYMQIYGTGFDTGDTVPTVLLFFDRRRFIFNVGEGLHRFCMEHKFKLSKIDHVFLTRVCSETSGGLPGLILTLAEMGESGLTVQTWGPSRLQDLAQAMHTFLPSGWMEHTHCFGAGKDSCALISSSPILLLEDELIKISAVLLHPENKPHHIAKSVSPEDTNDGDVVSTVYICELSTVPGKFDPDKAQEKGLKPGYKYGKLQKGESVMSDDGTIMVHPEDVMSPSSPGPIMLLVDCPSSSYIPSLASSASLQAYYSGTGKIVNCIIHIGPRPVTRSKDYQTWMENFKETHHIMARQEVKMLGTPTLRYSAKILSRLNLVCPQLFPILEPDVTDQKEAMNNHVIDGGNLLKYHFRPLADLGPDVSEIPEAFDHTAVQKHWSAENWDVRRACEISSQVIKRWSQGIPPRSSWKAKGPDDCQKLPACLQHASRDEMELVFLGTGSSQPAKHRNVTGIYIHLFERGGILLDCGEGTYAQLKRRYGAKGADDVLRGLKCIWISHMHADHFSGLARMLSARRQLLEAESAMEPILVVGPKRLKFFLGAYRRVEDLGVHFLDCSQTTLEVQSWVNKGSSDNRGAAAVHKKGLVSVSSEGGSGKSGMQHVWKRPGFHILKGIDVAGRESLRRVLNLLGLKDLCSVPVVHCPEAFAVVLEAAGKKISESETKPGWKLVFSGDTRPCQALVEAARGATILIHEATFDDGLIAEAVRKNHSMTKEAIEVGVAAQVYRIFLTHFSQRYPTIPSFDSCYKDRTCIAYDMMSINLADLPMVPEFVPALQLLFRDQTDVEEDLEVVSV